MTKILPILACYIVLVPSMVAMVFLVKGAMGIAIASALAIIAGSLLLAWATESAQFLVSQAFALAVLAWLQVLPEYLFEATLAWHRLIEYAAATMTGANRLLMGVGWPLIFFIAYAFSRKNGDPIGEIRLDARQSVEAFFLVVATAYSFIIVAKRTLDIVDGLVLLVIYLTYLRISAKMGGESDEEVDYIHGPARQIALVRSHRWKLLVIVLLLATGGVAIFRSAEPFVLSLLEVAVILGVSQYLFAQWLAPFLSEFPESTSAFYWASKIRLSPMAMGNLISSKVNQWTVLIATIPIVYSASLGHLAFIPLSPLQVEEILLTAAQSAFGCIALLKLRFNWKEAILLLSLWSAQFLYPPIRIEVTLAYLALTLVWVLWYRHQFTMFGEFKKAVTRHVLGKS